MNALRVRFATFTIHKTKPFRDTARCPAAAFAFSRTSLPLQVPVAYQHKMTSARSSSCSLSLDLGRCCSQRSAMELRPSICSRSEIRRRSRRKGRRTLISRSFSFCHLRTRLSQLSGCLGSSRTTFSRDAAGVFLQRQQRLQDV